MFNDHSVETKVTQTSGKQNVNMFNNDKLNSKSRKYWQNCGRCCQMVVVQRQFNAIETENKTSK